jgi:hypothetical protein
MSERQKTFEEFEESQEADYGDIRDELAKRPGSWVCILCETVFGPEIRSFRREDCAKTPELLQMIADDQVLCADCLLVLTTPPPNSPFGPGSAPS